MTVVRKRGRGLSPEELADLMAGTSLYVIYGIAVPMFPRTDRPHPSPEVYFRRIRSGNLPGIPWREVRIPNWQWDEIVVPTLMGGPIGWAGKLLETLSGEDVVLPTTVTTPGGGSTATTSSGVSLTAGTVIGRSFPPRGSNAPLGAARDLLEPIRLAILRAAEASLD
jgi:hypothetical protein